MGASSNDGVNVPPADRPAQRVRLDRPQREFDASQANTPVPVIVANRKGDWRPDQLADTAPPDDRLKCNDRCLNGGDVEKQLAALEDAEGVKEQSRGSRHAR